jgi:hypothetical protein
VLRRCRAGGSASARPANVVSGVTDKGQRTLLNAVPLWQEAHAQVEEALGREATTALNDMLDLSAGGCGRPRAPDSRAWRPSRPGDRHIATVLPWNWNPDRAMVVT